MIAVVEPTLPPGGLSWHGGVRLLGLDAVPPPREFYARLYVPEVLDGEPWVDDVLAPRVIAVDGRIKYVRGA